MVLRCFFFFAARCPDPNKIAKQRESSFEELTSLSDIVNNVYFLLIRGLCLVNQLVVFEKERVS